MIRTTSPSAVAHAAFRSGAVAQEAARREALVELPAILVVEADAERANRGRHRLGARGPGQRHDPGRQIPEPGEGDLERCRSVACGHRDERRLARDRVALARASERTVREQRNAFRHAASRDAVPQVVVAQDAELDLHRADRRVPQRFLELPQGDVAEADPLDEPVALERDERANAGGERRARVRRVELVEEQALHAEGAPAGLARRDQRSRATVGHPAAAGTGEAALRRDADPRAVAAPGGERARDQPLVVPDLGRVEAVRVGRVEKVDAGVEGCVQ